ncbi:uncharacterized protein LOC127718306 [Mytilus californianus]|uniref:uncharacterized protein LOC127718306 n=1 Tax=Mytilus californianus TaxID=6549 RepID=UPI0022484F92|nr:uncharacterized protein LOC127718306 [Mytilus californianus]
MFSIQQLKTRFGPYIVHKCCILRRYSILTKHDTIKVRRATLDDYDNVIAMRDPKELYGGYDPLPDTYKMIVESPTTVAYVATVNEKPEGVACASLIDDGKTVGMFGLRVSAKYHGCRLTRKLFNHIETVSHGTALQFVGCTYGTVSRKFASGFYIKCSDNVMSKKTDQYLTNSKKIADSLMFSKRNSTSAHVININHLKVLFSSYILCRHLFPGGRLLKYWLIYRIHPSNIPLIMNKRTRAVASCLHQPNNALITIGTYAYSFKGLVYNLDVYGNTDANFSEHLYLHLKEIVCLVEDKICFEIVIPDETPNKGIDEAFLLFGFERNNNSNQFRVDAWESSAK